MSDAEPGEKPFYNQIAGRSLHRLAGLVDGVFAIAMTLLVLDLVVPAAEEIHSEADLGLALMALAPRLVPYLMSFLTLGIFWVGQQTEAHLLAHSDRHYTWISIAFLFTITLIPFSTALLAEFITYRMALLLYWANIALTGLTLVVGWHYVQSHDLLKHDVPPGFHQAVRVRVFTGQVLYAVGAALCVIDTRLSIGFIVLVQLFFAIAPPVRPLRRF
jgi:uncharacterized membrane protein